MPAACRRASSNFGNVRLIGMTVDELTDVYKWEVRPNPDDRHPTVYMLPQDIIDNTRRAFSLELDLGERLLRCGAPEGRYFAPANSATCIQLRDGDCAPRTLPSASRSSPGSTSA